MEEKAEPAKKYFWTSWYHSAVLTAFELHHPWWISGYRPGNSNVDPLSAQTICAAIEAETEEEAKEIVLKSYDTPPEDLEWRFVTEKYGSPFSERFPRADWMQWDE